MNRRQSHNPNAMTPFQIGVLSFVTGAMFAITLSLMWSNV